MSEKPQDESTKKLLPAPESPSGARTLQPPAMIVGVGASAGGFEAF
jgi:chemotaxis response regulator CheB